jgi:hypothetical protein
VAFANLLAANATYDFIVWGYNRAGCAHTPVATVRVREAPGTITDVRGAMESRDDAWDFHVTRVSPSAGIDHYNIRSGDGTGPTVRFDGQGWPRELLDRPFGEIVGFQLQACAPWGSCGDWSATSTAPEESVSFAVTGLAYDEARGVFSWTNGPANGPLLPARYRCSVPADGPASVADADSPNSCVLPAPAPAGTVRLTVTVRIGGTDHSYDYDR